MNSTTQSLIDIMSIVNALFLCCSTSSRLEDGTMRGVTLVVVVIDVDIPSFIVVVIANACVFTLGIIVVIIAILFKA
jgi:hypothetical protein